MPAPYILPNATDIGNLYQITSYLNNISPIFLVVIGVIWIVSFIGSISEGRQASRAFIFSSFVCSMLSIMASLIGLLNKEYMYFSFLMVGIGLIWYKLDNAPGI